jgi:Na+/H+-translocating membrane pyrophosphatase
MVKQKKMTSAKASEESKVMGNSSSKEGLGISGFTLGVMSIPLAGSIGLILSIIGFFFCISQQKKHHMKLAKIGIILNIIAFILSVIGIIASYYLVQQIPGF